MQRIRLIKKEEKKVAKKKGRKKIIEKGVDLSLMETAIRSCNGLVTKAAKMLGVPIPTLQHYIRRYSTLRDALFETRSEVVDEAEESLRNLVRDKNLTAVIFTLKCLGQDRGYIDTPQKNLGKTAPIVINLMPASSDVKIPKVQVVKGNKKQSFEGEKGQKALPAAVIDDDDEMSDDEVIEIESEVVNG